MLCRRFPGQSYVSLEKAWFRIRALNELWCTVGGIGLDECAAFMLQVVAVVANFYLLCYYASNDIQEANRELC